MQLSGPGATTGYVFGDRGRTDEVITAFALDKLASVRGLFPLGSTRSNERTIERRMFAANQWKQNNNRRIVCLKPQAYQASRQQGRRLLDVMLRPQSTTTRI
ncbi:uncharacterized protein LOC144634355 isoform X2 [Oculina patagonica]